MSVGVITGGLSVSYNATSITVSFKRPANVTKYQIILNSSVNLADSVSLSFNAKASVGSKESFTISSGLNKQDSYYVYVTPFNGSTAGVAVSYLNNQTSNTVQFYKASTTSSQQPGAQSAGNNGLPSYAISPTPTTIGTGANGGSSNRSPAAASNTPAPTTGTVISAKPSDLASAGRVSIKTDPIAANQTYSIKVRAKTTDASGATIYSEYSPPLVLTTPAFAADGLNMQSNNNNTDIRLSGGSLFASSSDYPFESNLGLFDPLVGSTSGSGVILNQYGLAGFNQGTSEFYLNARDGSATFAGTITSPSIQSTNYSASTAGSEPKYTVVGTLIDLQTGAISSEKFRIDTLGNAYFAGDVSNNATIGGTLASTIISYANAGEAISLSGLRMVGNLLSNSTGQIQSVSTNGTTFYSGSSATTGARVLVNQYGLLGYKSTSTGNDNGVSFAILSTDQTIDGNVITAGSAIFSGVVQGSTFTSTNYKTAGHSGFAIATSGNVDSVNFSYGTSVVAYISANDAGSVTMGSKAQNTYINVGGATGSIVSVLNAVPSYGGTSGHLRNIWANVSTGTVPAANDAVSQLTGMLSVPQVGDIYVIYS